MKKAMVTISLLLATLALIAQQKPAYILYKANGKKVSYKKMIRLLAEKDIVLFGEFHNNPISHWLELAVSKDLSEKKALVFGAEMFEADNQQALNDFLSGKLSAKGFGKSDPKVDCKENCTEEENALNRRSEFMIVKQE